MHATCHRLAETPSAFPIVPCCERCTIRRCIHGDCLIFYRAEAGRMAVLHVRHGAMAYAAIVVTE
ncbi:type II toxin-antitoxin system RelE/ParE family toxin [Salinisphaera sp. LB1]|uniref:type II toxin-antitoxin system RelE/ParE family toxin n=1 Tax=Salinisphaera sp. LB1 TaxID=2183911 RepID=UPI000D7083A5